MKKLYNITLDFFYVLFRHRSIIKDLEKELEKGIEIRISEFQAKANQIRVDMESPLLAIFVNHCIEVFKAFPGAANYLAVSVIDKKTLEPYEFTIQRKLGKTPADVNGELERENKTLKETIGLQEVVLSKNKEQLDQLTLKLIEQSKCGSCK